MTTYEANRKLTNVTPLTTSKVGGASTLAAQFLRLSTIKHPKICVLGLAACAVFSLGPVVASAEVYAATSPVAPPYVAPHYDADFSKDTGFYASGEVGPSFMPDFQSSRFGFPGSFRMDTGLRASAELGYNFLATSRFTLGGEFESGLIYNRISHVRDAGSPLSLRGDYYQAPLLNNLVLRLHPNSFVTPYVGVGGGGDCSWARIDKPGFYGSETHSDRVDPAVQGMGGVRFRLNDRMDVGLGYKYLAAFPNEGKYIGTHSVMANFTVRF